MLVSSEIVKYVKAAPFRPFCIHMASGKTLEIRHPEMIKVGKNVMMVFTLVSDNPEVFDDWQSVSLLLAESISFLNTAAVT